jgi:hypothetical protein
MPPRSTPASRAAARTFSAVAKHGDVRQSLTRANGGGGDGARIFAFGQHDALRVGGSALSDALENGHEKLDSFQCSVFSNRASLSIVHLLFD